MPVAPSQSENNRWTAFVCGVLWCTECSASEARGCVIKPKGSATFRTAGTCAEAISGCLAIDVTQSSFTYNLTGSNCFSMVVQKPRAIRAKEEHPAQNISSALFRCAMFGQQALAALDYCKGRNFRWRKISYQISQTFRMEFIFVLSNRLLKK